MANIVVGVAQMAVSKDRDKTLVTYALGSCLGLTLYDPWNKIGGLLHVQMPDSKIAPERAIEKPSMFIDTAIPIIFNELMAIGAKRHSLIISLAGGASIASYPKDVFEIGKRNIVTMRQYFWKHCMMIQNEDVGGKKSRSMFLDIETGKTWIQSMGEINVLSPGSAVRPSSSDKDTTEGNPGLG